jgi:hypothetical protein
MGQIGVCQRDGAERQQRYPGGKSAGLMHTVKLCNSRGCMKQF